MALNQKNTSANFAAFESEAETLNVIDTRIDETPDTVVAAPVVAAPAPAPAPAPATATAVAVSAPTSSALARPGAAAVMATNVMSALKDAFHVDFDSLPRIAAEQGSFTLKDDDTELGSEVVIQLMSYQSSWVASPNDTKADVELVKFSEDGVTSKDGVNLLEHVADLKAQGYAKAKIAHRVVLVGELLSAKVEGAGPVGDLVMLDLPDSGRRAFNTYTLQASYAVGKGRKTAEQVATLTLKAVKDKTKSGEVYTRVTIS